MTEFATRLRQVRELAGMEQKELAALAGLPATSISHFESGRREPALDNFVAIVKALNVSADLLLGTRPKGTPS